MKIVEMVDVKVPSGGECKRDGAGIDDSSLGMTMPLYAEGMFGDDAIHAGRIKNQQLCIVY
jgi:hypothetical protein